MLVQLWRCRGPARLTPIEVVVDQLRHRVRDAGDGGEVGEGGAAHGLGGAEMLQQRALARRADALDLIERVLDDVLLAARPVRADGEAVGLVAQALHVIEYWVAMRQ